MKILIVSSSGGHLYKTIQLKQWWEKYDRVWVTKNDAFSRNLLQDEKVFYGYFPEQRNIVNFFKNFLLARQLFKQEKPSIIFSMGAGIAPPFFLLAKIYHIPTIFIETFISIPQPTLSGKIIYPFADLFYVQNKSLKQYYPTSKFAGSIL